MEGKVKVLLWDVDGTFVDTERLHFSAWQKLMKQFGKELSVEEYVPMIGRGSEENMRELCAKKGITGSIDELQKTRRDFYLEIRKGGVPTIPQNIEFAHDCKKEFPHLIHAAVSSARRIDLDENIAVAGLTDFFVRTVSYEDRPGLKRKPAPDLYKYAMEELNVSSHECLALEDSSNGVEAAVSADIRTVALPNPLTQTQNFSAAALVIPYTREKAARDIGLLLSFSEV